MSASQSFVQDAFVLSLLILSICSHFLVTAELQYVQLLFRHGDRAPIELYPTDPNLNYKWPYGLAKLTPLGMKQHYAHGKFLREMYKDFITTDPSEIDVISAGADRCIRSAEVNLATFYAPADKWKFENDVDWQPLPIQYLPIPKDKYLESESVCPRADEEEKNVINSPGGQKIVKDNWEMFMNLTKSAGKDIHAWKTASYLYDVLSIEKYYNLTTPAWAEAYWNQLYNVRKLSFFWNFNSPLLLRLRVGPLLGLIIEKFENKIHNETFGGKIQVYSGHDTNIANVLHALNIYDMMPPPYCATLLFELHKIKDVYAVRLLYLNSTTPETGHQVPNLLVLKGCSEFCPLEYFKNYTQKFIPEDWESECGLPKDNENQCFASKNFVIALGVALVLVMVLVMLLTSRLKQKRNERVYHLLPHSALAL